MSCSQNSQETREAPSVEESPPLLTFTTGIRSILEDSKGRLWIGSHNEGVAVYNGTEVTYFGTKDGLSHSQVRNIYEDHGGKVWFETGEGISYYDGAGVVTFSQRDYSAKETWSAQPGDLWFKGDEMVGYSASEGYPGAYRYDGQAMSYLTFPIEVAVGDENYYSITTPFFRGRRGVLWFGTYGAVFGYDGTDFTIIDNDYVGLTEETGYLHIRDIMEDSKGNLWIGNNGIGVLKYDGDRVVDFTQEMQLKKGRSLGNPLDRVFSIGEDAEGNVWFGTYLSGAWRYDGQTMTNFTEIHGLLSNQIWTIYTSKQGELWLGGAEPSGVYRFNGLRFERVY